MDENIHVLCVDDEPRVTEALAMNLRRHFRVSTALNGQAGLAIVDSNDSPTVVVSDMRMPEMDGAAFLSQVREHAPVPVRILLTGQADIELAVSWVNFTAKSFAFLPSPARPKRWLQPCGLRPNSIVSSPQSGSSSIKPCAAPYTP